jgi:hypothetical protein
MCAGHGAEFLRLGDTGEPHEVADRVLVGTPCARVAKIGKPLDLGQHIRQAVELGGGKQPAGWGDFGRKLLAHDRGRTMLHAERSIPHMDREGDRRIPDAADR